MPDLKFPPPRSVISDESANRKFSRKSGLSGHDNIADIHFDLTLGWHGRMVPTWEAIKIALVMIGATMASIIAIEVAMALLKRGPSLYLRRFFSSIMIMLGLLFCLAYFAQPWLLPFPWPGLILPVSGIVWHFYGKRRLR